jgi:rare lipoprotein A (peptidoglycan hydrolase)
VAKGRIGPGGSFAIAWRPRRTGELTLRAALAGSGTKTASAATAPPTATSDATLSVYRQVLVTWYGPGFYGRHTACGERLTRSIVGVAARTLPCGTPVSLRYRGQTLVVPVIDRGPYGTAAVLDLTHAAAAELGVKETVPVGMIALAGPPIAATNWYPPSGSAGSSGGTPAVNAGGATIPGTATRSAFALRGLRPAF